MESGKWKVESGTTRKKNLRIALIFLLLSTFNFQLSIAQQGDIETQNAVKRRAQERLAEIDRQTKALSGDIVRSERDLKVARASIAAKRKVASELEKESARVSARMEEHRAEVVRLDSAQRRLRAGYGRMVRRAWVWSKGNSEVQFLFASRDFGDASRRLNFIRRTNRARERRGVEIDSLGRRLGRGLEELGVRSDEIAGLRRESDKLLANLGEEQKRYEQSIKSLGSDRKRLDAEAKRERAKIAAAQREIERLMASQVKKAGGAALTEAETALSGRFGDNRGRLPWPTATGGPGLILHHFGKERTSDGLESEFKGLIIAAAPGSDVKAVFEGTVTLITPLGQYDKCVMVRSGEYVVGYGNVSAPAVKNGERVSTGQVLGTTATSANPERHLVLLWMQRGGEVLDPEKWLR